MSRYQSPSYYHPCGCGKKHSRQESRRSYHKEDVQSYRPSKYDYYSDEKNYNNYDYFSDQLEGSRNRNRCNCPYCRRERRRKEKRYICHCRPY